MRDAAPHALNRTTTSVGLSLLLVAIALIASPEALAGAETVTPLLEIGVFVLPVGLSVVLWGASSPDPRVTTVGGVFGNPEENVMRRTLKPARPTLDVRYIPNPRESVNCRYCYTLIPWNAAECARCGMRRECRGCGKALYYLSGGIRCLPCARNETYCNCPRLKRAEPAGRARRPARR